MLGVVVLILISFLLSVEGRGKVVKNVIYSDEIESNNNDQNRYFYWVSNNNGMYSQYLQAKLILYVAEKLNRTLVLVPFESSHYKGVPVDLCTFCSIPSNIICKPVPKNVKCVDEFPANIMKSKAKSLCYTGQITLDSGKNSRQFVTEAIEEVTDLPFKINPILLTHYNEFKTALGIMDKNTKFTVVHWRRGDQLKARCGQHGQVNLSINCFDADYMIKFIKKYTNDSIVFIATNEPTDSFQIKFLNLYGYHTFHSIASKLYPNNTATVTSPTTTATTTKRALTKSKEVNNKHSAAAVSHENHNNDHNFTQFKNNAANLQPPATSAHIFDLTEILAIESMLMIEATTFLAWGVSEVNDVIEYERYLLKKPFCIDQTRVTDMNEMTWCAYQDRKNLVAKNLKFSETFIQAADRFTSK